jgi:PAS domain-containing protein
VVVTFADVCDLKQTEEALAHQAELRWPVPRRRSGGAGGIFDSIADGFFAFDQEWRITHVNDAALRHYGKTRDEMVGNCLIFPAARKRL